jgi:DNA end-binding protein Ku
VWKGTITFGLVSVNVRVFSATQENDISFKQVHVHAEGEPGYVKQKRVCSVCGEEVPYDQIDKGYEAADGVIVLTKDDIAAIPLDTLKAIAVSEFVPAGSVDPIMFERVYYLAPDNDANTKAYALLRDGIAAAGKVGIVKVTLRQREQVAMLHVRDGGAGDPVLALTTLRWADEVRHASLPILAKMPPSTEQELEMARMLIDALGTDTFDASAYEDGYRHALEAVIASKQAGVVPLHVVEEKPSGAIDLMAALRASVAAAKAKREAASEMAVAA